MRGTSRYFLPIVVALIASAWIASAGSAAEQASGGSILRLVSGAEGLQPEPGPPSLDPNPVAEPGARPLAPAEGLPGAKWNSPYEPAQAGFEACNPARPGLCRWFPAGIIPVWGARTPDRYRFAGPGHPLQGTSWLNRPLSAGWMAGGILGNHLIGDRVTQRPGFFGGYRLGWDYDHYWGTEFRLSFAELGLHDRGNLLPPETDSVWLGDVDLLYYPWGDSQWRPFFMAGLGLAHFRFSDDLGIRYNQGLLGLPLGGGVKYRVHEWLVVRLDVIDNLAIGGAGLSTMNNVAFTAGVEVRFGGFRRHYWPWNPGRTLW